MTMCVCANARKRSNRPKLARPKQRVHTGTCAATLFFERPYSRVGYPCIWAFGDVPERPFVRVAYPGIWALISKRDRKEKGASTKQRGTLQPHPSTDIDCSIKSG